MSFSVSPECARAPPARQYHRSGITDNTLLCYWRTEEPGNTLLNEVNTAGWKIFAADSPVQVTQITERYQVPVGMLFVDSDASEEQLEEAYSAISSAGDIVWLCLLNDDHRMNDGVCNLVATSCNDFFTPPYESRRILETIGHAAGLSRIRHRSVDYRLAPETFHGMIGNSPSMRRLFIKIAKVAKSDAPVLLEGESGTGKEQTAKAIHRLSARASAPLVAVNCAALPSTLVQAELFGHEKGAFTGADRRRIGRIEEATGGVLFLDEIGDMPMDQQVNLLRFLEDGHIERLGGNGKLALDVRVVAATHEDLEELVSRGQFREDLYYRLNVLRLEVPALSERDEDIELLARCVLEKYSNECEYYRIRGFDKRCLKAMRAYAWPGNVRELINRVRSAMVMSDGAYITAIDLGLYDRRDQKDCIGSLEMSRAQSDRRCVEAALKHSRHNMSQAARELGISRTTLYRMMEKLEIPHH